MDKKTNNIKYIIFSTSLCPRDLKEKNNLEKLYTVKDEDDSFYTNYIRCLNENLLKSYYGFNEEELNNLNDPEELKDIHFFKKAEENVYFFPELGKAISKNDAINYLYFLKNQAINGSENEGGKQPTGYPQDLSDTLFILHRSDLGLRSDYREKFLNNSELENLFNIKDDSAIKIIVFQHDDDNSKNIYGDILMNKINERNLFCEILKSYNILSKPWGELIDLRRQLIWHYGGKNSKISKEQINELMDESLETLGEYFNSVSKIKENNIHSDQLIKYIENELIEVHISQF